MKPKVLIIVGSDSDIPVMEEAGKVLKDFNIPFDMTIASAHRSPERVLKIATGAEKRGIEVIIAGAGMSAHLAGVIASHTILPVIGVPLSSSPLSGFDSLLSMVQMPGGVPVAVMSLGKAGARNAGIFAVQILSRKDLFLEKKLHAFKNKQAKQVEEKAKGLR
ncbi:MAG: 5-(carboxyamino)imidazole ribonucleotide mutase [Nitrospirae bacterium]|nr:5-(carboxyamino)imidazole ribonucleotide mutase [Nitrospirota bacterium]